MLKSLYIGIQSDEREFDFQKTESSQFVEVNRENR